MNAGVTDLLRQRVFVSNTRPREGRRPSWLAHIGKLLLQDGLTA